MDDITRDLAKEALETFGRCQCVQDSLCDGCKFILMELDKK